MAFPSRLACLLLCLGAAACSGGGGGGGGGPGGFIIDVEPSQIVRGRTTEVFIRGDETSWLEDGLAAEDIQFGQGITVESLTIANDQFIKVELAVMGDSPLGPRDIQVGGLDFAGIVEIVRPFEVVGGSRVAPGRFFEVEIRGVDTDWLSDVTVTAVEANDVVVDPLIDLFPVDSFDDGYAGTEYVRYDFVILRGYVRWNALPGPVTLRIESGGASDVSVGALDVVPIEVETLPSTGVENAALLEPFASNLYHLEMPPFHECTVIPVDQGNDVTLFAYYYLPEFPDLVHDGGVFFGEMTYYDEDIYLVTFDVDHGGGTSGYEFSIDVECVDLAPEPLAPAAADSDLVPADGTYEKLYLVSPTPWSLLTVTGTPATMDAVVELRPSGRYSILPDVFYQDQLFEGGAETMSAFLGTRIATLAVYDYYSGEGAGTEFDVEWTETPLPGAVYVEDTEPVAIPDAPGENDGAPYAELTFEVAETTPITQVHVALDIVHAGPDDIDVDLISPAGTEVRIVEDGLGSDVDILTVLPDVAVADGDLSLFEGEVPQGTWRLRVRDEFPTFSGWINGCALSFE